MRPVRPDDAPAVEALVARTLGGSVYLGRTIELVRHAVERPDAENRGIVLEGADGVVLFGSIAGTDGTARIQAVIGADSHALVAAAVAALDARKVVAEVPDDAHHSPMISALASNGFREAARIADYVRDGVDLVILEY